MARINIADTDFNIISTHTFNTEEQALKFACDEIDRVMMETGTEWFDGESYDTDFYKWYYYQTFHSHRTGTNILLRPN